MLLTGQPLPIPNPIPAPIDVGNGSTVISIDPDNQRIQYGGTSRPKRRIAGLQFGLTASTTIGANGSHAASFSATVENKLWLSFGPIPDWVDVTEPITLNAIMSVPSNLTTPNATARIFARLSYQRINSIPFIDAGLLHDHTFDTGGGYTASTAIGVSLQSVPGGSLQHGDLITASIQRVSTAPEDTIASALLVYDTPWLEVTQNEVA